MANVDETILCRQCGDWRPPSEFTLIGYGASDGRPLCHNCTTFNTTKAQMILAHIGKEKALDSKPGSPLSKHFSQDWGFMDRQVLQQIAKEQQQAYVDSFNKIGNSTFNVAETIYCIECKKWKQPMEYTLTDYAPSMVGGRALCDECSRLDTTKAHIDDKPSNTTDTLDEYNVKVEHEMIDLNKQVEEASIHHKRHYAVGDKDLYSHFIESFGLNLWLRHVEMEAIQYLERARSKGSYTEDIRKVITICDRILTELEGK